jgi:hypothetical protein
MWRYTSRQLAEFGNFLEHLFMAGQCHVITTTCRRKNEFTYVVEPAQQIANGLR